MDTTKSKKIKIIIADDHPVFRAGLELVLKQMPIISKITHASSGEEVIKLLQSEQYGLVLMDIKMSPMDGIQTTEIISRRFTKTIVIALSMHEDRDKIMAILSQGAKGYLLKNADKSEIEMAIREVTSGGNYYSPSVAKMMYDGLSGKLSQQDDILQNDRFRDIIYLLYHELTSEEIAEAMFLSVRTIEDYRSRILSLTNSKNAIGILKIAIESGLPNDLELKNKFEKYLNKNQPK